MNIVTTSSLLFAPILGLLLVALVIVVVITVIALAARNDDGRPRITGPVTYFLLGISLATLAIGVTTAGIVTHSVSDLVGPAASDSFSSSISSSCFPTTDTTLPNNNFSGGSDSCSSGPSSVPLISGSGDNDNHSISVAVAAGLFGLAALAGFLLVWRRVLATIRERGIGVPPLGRLPLSYAYLVAGLAALSLLVFAPLAADNIFRAIAPGVNETSGHADGVRNLITFLVLTGLATAILVYHLRFASRLRTEPPAGELANSEPSGQGL